MDSLRLPSPSLFRRTLVMLASTFVILTACAAPNDGHVHRVAHLEFCIPPDLTVESVGWIPEDSERTPVGFSFHGCANNSRARPSCDGLTDIISVDVEPSISSQLDQNWAEQRKDALFSRMSGEADTSVERHQQTLVLANPRIWPEWFIWESLKGPYDALTLSDGDILQAACSRIEDSPTSSFELSGKKFACRRYPAHGDYAIRYSFVTDSRAPDHLGQIDAALRTTIDSWRCPAH